MNYIRVSGLSEEEREIIERAADNAGMSLSEFGRTRLRAGMRMWDTADGAFDTYEFQSRLKETQPEPAADDPDPAEASKRDRFATSIKKNIPKEGNEAVSKSELVDIVAEDVISDVLDDLLDDGNVKYSAADDGFVRVD